MHTKGILLFAILSASAQAQTSRGTVSGTITDPSGAAVAGANVAITHTATGVRRTVISNDAGIYRFDAVDLGAYDLKVTHPGFKLFLATGLGVEANRITTVDPRLELGAEATAVQVSAEAESLTVRDGPFRGGNFQPRQVSQVSQLSGSKRLSGRVNVRRLLGERPARSSQQFSTRWNRQQ